jgi:hypothetical protein
MADKCNEIVSDVFGVQEIASYISSKHEYSSGYCDKKKLEFQAVSNNPKKRPMNKQSYKKAALEHGDFQSPVQAIQHHVELAMAHSIYGRNRAGQNNAYFKYGLS